MKDLYERRVRRREDESLFGTAHVFTIHDDAVRVATNLAEIDGGVSRITPWIRLPFDRVFVQWRAKAQFAPGDVARPDAAFFPTWHGALLERVGTDRAEEPFMAADDVFAHVIMETPEGAVPNPVSALFSKHDLSQHTSKSAFRYVWGPFYDPAKLPFGDIDQWREEVHAELFLLPWLMAVINSPNLTTEKAHWRSTARTRSHPHGQLVKHHSVSLKISRVQMHRMGIGDGATLQQRLHAVRGHWKIRKTGVYWWNDFMRGDAARGTITKDYTVAA